jgi:N-acetyl-anhydromuramyl-L-alanine amidase AmpD
MGLPPIYPMVSKILYPDSMTVGPLVPIGVTVHYTADRDPERAAIYLRRKGFGYHLLVDRNGSVIQLAYCNKRVNHAGKAAWNGSSPNRFHIAVAVLSWGELSPEGMTWAGNRLPAAEVAVRNDLFGRERSWDACTPEQELSLYKILTWAVALGVKPSNICGHDECALPRGRKLDPGGVLLLTMKEIRAAMEKLCGKRS